MEVHDGFDDGQTEACSLGARGTRAVRSEESVEYVGQIFLLNPVAGVAYCYLCREVFQLAHRDLDFPR